jgi:hypothetical protein
MQTGSYSLVPVEKIIWGVPADEALRPQVEERGARRIPQYCDGTSRSIETSSANLRKRQEIPAGASRIWTCGEMTGCMNDGC